VSYEGYERLRVSLVGGVATVWIDNPPINLFDLTLYMEMQRLVAEVGADPEARVVVLRSAVPGWFIAHFDVSLIQQIPTDLPEPTELHAFHLMVEGLRTMPKATIAVLEGRAGGGGSELALSCDLRFADRDQAMLNQPEVALGILPGGSGTQRLARLVGRSRALEVILGCEDIDAVTAERWGWVNRALPTAELWPFVDRLAARIASFPPHAVAAAKASVLRAEKEVPADLLAEAAAFNATLAHAETQGAMARFFELGGQTVEGESRLGALAGELGTPPA
jgi:enoyl-CoA hydratase/carnithine racemase